MKSEEFFKIGQLEQYGRRLNLKFDGIPHQANDNVTDIVIEVSKKLYVEVRRSDTVSLSLIGSPIKNIKWMIRHLGQLQ